MQTQRLALMHERLALVMAARHPLAIRELTFSFPLMREMLQHHPTRAGDPGLIWLRERIHEPAELNNFR